MGIIILENATTAMQVDSINTKIYFNSMGRISNGLTEEKNWNVVVNFWFYSPHIRNT